MQFKAPAASVTAAAWTVSYNSEFRYFSWRNTLGTPATTLPGNPGRGSQIYVPSTLSIVGVPNADWKIELFARGGYVWSQQRTAGQSGEVSTLTDSQLSGTLTYNGINGIQPFASMLVNLPTGTARLPLNSRFARADGDLVDIGSFGEGWNLGPTLGVNVALSPSLLATFSLGHTFRGAFNKEGFNIVTFDIDGTDRVRNGDDTTATFALGYSEGAFSTQGSISYAWNTPSQVNQPGDFNYQRYRMGDRVTLTGSMNYMLAPEWTASVDGFWSRSERNRVLDFAGVALIPEAFNSNSTIYRINTGLTYRTPSGFAVGPIASYMNRDSNSWDPATFAFLPAKTRWSLGGTASYVVSNKVSINSKIEKVWIREREAPGPFAPPPNLPAMNGDGWAVALGANVSLSP